MTARRTALCFLSLATTTMILTAAGCSSDEDPSTTGGLDNPRAVVDAHIAAARSYDIAADCNLLTPDRRRELAELDGLEVDTYCATVTAPIEADADDETRARTRALYTGATVIELDRPGGTWFSLESADGSYTEQIETVEVDGSWWVGTIDSDGDILEEGHDHEDVDPAATEAPVPPEDGSGPTTGN
ncbi:MAG: hypothetical protein ABI239_02565 [Aquihabitans sp.]